MGLLFGLGWVAAIAYAKRRRAIAIVFLQGLFRTLISVLVFIRSGRLLLRSSGDALIAAYGNRRLAVADIGATYMRVQVIV